MGGYFSTRWNAEHTRPETGPLLKLDAASLRRLGAFTPGAICSVQWTDGRSDDAGSILTRMHPTGDALTLIYSIREHGGDWQPLRERIMLDATPCTYGGERLWLTCPRCLSRRRVLYSLGGRFRCRQCHDLAYSSTREDVVERSQRRTRKLQRRLGAPASAGIFDLPPRPRDMRWETYSRIVDELLEEWHLQLHTLIGEHHKAPRLDLDGVVKRDISGHREEPDDVENMSFCVIRPRPQSDQNNAPRAFLATTSPHPCRVLTPPLSGANPTLVGC